MGLIPDHRAVCFRSPPVGIRPDGQQRGPPGALHRAAAVVPQARRLFDHRWVLVPRIRISKALRGSRRLTGRTCGREQWRTTSTPSRWCLTGRRSTSRTCLAWSWCRSSTRSAARAPVRHRRTSAAAHRQHASNPGACVAPLPLRCFSEQANTTKSWVLVNALKDKPWAAEALDWRQDLPRLGLLRTVLALTLMAGRKLPEGAWPQAEHVFSRTRLTASAFSCWTTTAELWEFLKSLGLERGNKRLTGPLDDPEEAIRQFVKEQYVRELERAGIGRGTRCGCPAGQNTAHGRPARHPYPRNTLVRQFGRAFVPCSPRRFGIQVYRQGEGCADGQCGGDLCLCVGPARLRRVHRGRHVPIPGRGSFDCPSPSLRLCHDPHPSSPSPAPAPVFALARAHVCAPYPSLPAPTPTPAPLPVLSHARASAL